MSTPPSRSKPQQKPTQRQKPGPKPGSGKGRQFSTRSISARPEVFAAAEAAAAAAGISCSAWIVDAITRALSQPRTPA